MKKGSVIGNQILAKTNLIKGGPNEKKERHKGIAS
jgi:hypothetical protein